jgi:hypothetical protein
MTRLLTAAALIAALTAPASAGSSSFYSPTGAYIGGSITRGNSTTFTNRNGSYIGSSTTRGNTTTIYDSRGSRAGSITRTGPGR